MVVRAAAQRVARWWWMLAGLLCVAVGGVGIIVPGLPTTVFFVMAAWCFSRSSPRFERWVLGLPTIGPMVRDYRAGLGMPRRAKTWAVSMIAGAVTLSAYLTRDRVWLALSIVVVGAVGVWFVGWHIPTRKTDVDEHHRGTPPAP
jgi:uncharacterized membrane protein YbaN (DUF454 family)